MANPTTNFNWQMPTNTDLVKDLPADFEVFGQAVDTSLMDLKGGTTGQILSKASNTDMDFTWIANDQGDITAVNVTSPITGGGTAGAVTVGIQDGTTAQKGAVQLEDSTSSTSTTKAATPNSVKSAYDLANGAIAKSTLNAKGDLISASANDTPSILTVGNNGETLVADSSATTGLRWQSNYAAAKNAIINGDFRINQRAFSSTTTNGTYGFDRWFFQGVGGTTTYSAETFTPGTAPVSGYEGINFARIASTGQTLSSAQSNLRQHIEDARTFADRTVTVSFWAKAASGTPSVAIELQQYFGSGGSPSSTVNYNLGKVTLSTSWQRFSSTIALNSLSGVTFGTNNNSSLLLILWTSAGSNFDSRTGTLGIQTATIDFWGVQVEAANTATAFQTATGTLAGELQAAQRYYYRQTAPDAYSNFGTGFAVNTTASRITIVLPVPMRTKPSTTVESANLALYDGTNIHAPSSITIGENNTQTPSVNFAYGTATLTANRPYSAISNNSTAAYLGFSAEL